MAEYYDPETYPKEWNYLQSGTNIDQYIIERELAHGGFSSVYLARQSKDQVQVIVKEYLPRMLAHRTWNNMIVANSDETEPLFRRGRALFLEEAKALARLKHPNIVEVINFFKAKSTVYMVMTYDYGLTLDKILSDKTLPISEDIFLAIFNSLLAGIGHLHQHQFVHLDIKPANILVRPGFDALLLDFGAIQTYPKVQMNKQTNVLTQGFSPIEQYQSDTQLGPWTDIYSVGASMRACLDLKAPFSAPERHEQDKLIPAVKVFKNKFPESLLSAIDWAMELLPENRPRSVAELQQALLK
ncbi:MAG: serine/threonine protein kinase [Methylococcaceae bacterium]|nr:serine/threonine protein kinase [Methylococcaceae bacterium]